MEGLSFDNAEHLQVVRYKPNEYYKKHFDTQHKKISNEPDRDDIIGHRVVTMLIYLNDEFEEGATRFTVLKEDIKPPKYSGILFHSLGKTNKKCHPYSRHAGLPVKSGEKYVANVWIRQNKFSHGSFNPYYFWIKYLLEIGTPDFQNIDHYE
jgi:prolyl 4-hydroxylase